MPFEGFLDNRFAVETAQSFLKRGRVPHAFLILGEKGLGKKTFARMFASVILCAGADVPQEQIYGQVCRDIYPDCVQVVPEGRARSFHIDRIRELLEGLYLAPNQGSFRVYLLADCHLMTEQAQNALLKALEEPPAHVVFLLTCSDSSSLLPTILSRSYPIRLNPVSIPQCAAFLEEKAPGEPVEERERAAFLAGGNIGRALALLTDENAKAALSGALAFLEGAADGEELGLLTALAPLEKSKALAVESLEAGQSLLSALLREKTGTGPQEGVPEQVKVLAGKMSLDKLSRVYEATANALEQMNGNVSPSLALESLCASFF